MLKKNVMFLLYSYLPFPLTFLSKWEEGRKMIMKNYKDHCTTFAYMALILSIIFSNFLISLLSYTQTWKIIFSVNLCLCQLFMFEPKWTLCFKIWPEGCRFRLLLNRSLYSGSVHWLTITSGKQSREEEPPKK